MLSFDIIYLFKRVICNWTKYIFIKLVLNLGFQMYIPSKMSFKIIVFSHAYPKINK